MQFVSLWKLCCYVILFELIAIFLVLGLPVQQLIALFGASGCCKKCICASSVPENKSQEMHMCICASSVLDLTWLC